ncbi:hypothetical protein BP6252_01146 [Coleophoma cylindrospora]|uniref:NDT80 domain-containing protein n=1 Tax=Coleophoma cylindrospora TaxID=1849047 RepID=A0A3D8SSA7_9HELO|nr:hypothetical protein BP6252_01146 [Coleophoma cylindrospora]
MAGVKPEDHEHLVWHGYTMPQSLSSHRQPLDASFQLNPYSEAPPRESYQSLHLPASTHTPSATRGGEGLLSSSPPSLGAPQGYHSLKRAYSEDIHYGDSIQDFREEPQEVPKPAIQQDHRLLSFGRLPAKNTLLDQHGRPQQIDLSAQIHGMFFLSEMGTPGVDGTVQPELTCYRRNLFQISGSVTAPRRPESVITERGDRLPVTALEIMVSAIESVDGHSVKLIVIPWKTPPPNSPEVGSGQEHEPTAIPLLSFEEGSLEGNSDYAIYPIAYRRLQFRIATANNGRRRELQQHFVLHLNVVATLANGQKINVCETTTAPIVVRGRSPRNFQARREIPLVGSSASRGPVPEMQAVPNVASSRPVDARIAKPSGPLELPRGAFTFESGHLPSSPLLMRQQTYPSWHAAQHSSGHSINTSPPSSLPPNMPQGDYMHVSHSDTTLHSSGTSMAQSTTIPAPSSSNQPQYQFSAPPQPASPTGHVGRFWDSNPRPAKSPRHMTPPELSAASYADYGITRYETTYPANNEAGPPLHSSPLSHVQVQEREYFPIPNAIPMQAWTTASDVGGIYQTSLPSTTPAQYGYAPNQGFVKQEEHPQQHYTWNHL